MGWKHLGAELKTEIATSSVQGLIKGMADGGAAHQADALRFGLYAALRLKGPNVSHLALLKCADKKCEGHNNPVSYQSLGRGIACTECWSESMVCADCGHARVDHCTWCKGCRGLFK